MAARRGGTRDRILDEALRLFAGEGFAEVSVGEIEEAVGLAPRRGGFYRHFESKEAVLAATVEHHAARLAALLEETPVPHGASPAKRLRGLAQWGLAFLRAQRPLLRVLARDGDRLPDLRAQVHRRLVAPGYDLARREFAALRPGCRAREARGVAAIALGALVHWVEDEDIYGIPPAAASEREFLDAWVAMLTAWARAPGRRV